MKKIYKLLMMSPVIFSLCSCDRYTEIENRNILTAIYTDYENGIYSVGGAVANVRSLSDSMADNPVSLVVGDGSSLTEARTTLEKRSDHDIYAGALRAVIIGDGIGNINSAVNLVCKEEDFRPSTALFCTSNSIEEIASLKQINDFSAGFAANSIIRSLQDEGMGVVRTVADFIYAKDWRGSGIAIPCIASQGDIMEICGYNIYTDGSVRGFVSDNIFTVFLTDKASVSTAFGGAHLKGRRIETFIQDGTLRVLAHFEFETEAANSEAVMRELEQRLLAICDKEKQTGCDFLELYKYRLAKERQSFEKLNWQKLIENMHITTTLEVNHADT